MFKIYLIVYICLSCILAINSSKAGRWLDKDTVVVTAASTNSKDVALQTRQKRQFGNVLPYEYLTSPTCFTRAGALGRCLTFQQCYQFFKMPSPLSHYENLMLSMQDPCSYVESSGKQDVGVCCSDFRYIASNQFPVQSPYQPIDTNEASTYDQTFSKWPPPIPTHPPNHAAPTHPPVTGAKWPPPLPTHPPSYPSSSVNPAGTWPSNTWPSNSWPTTKPPQWPPTTKPTWPTASKPTWPPPSKPTWPATTKPPYQKPEWPPVTKPTTTYPTTAADAEDVPLNLAECGVKNGYQDQERIVGGHNAEPGEWPWMAAILTSGRLFCGGSLIDDTHILTAAHCVAHMNPWDVARLRVHLGDYNIKSKGDVQHIERKVKKVVRHRGFDPQTLYNDIALLTLDVPIQFTKNVRPICLPQGKTAYSGRMATVIGWGSLREMGPTPGILQEVNIPIWTNHECKSKYGPAAPGGIVESFLCAGKASKDSCSGDSGGPLMINDGKWQQIGIVSWGIGCGKGQFPGVYTRITSFMGWINKNLNV